MYFERNAHLVSGDLIMYDIVNSLTYSDIGIVYTLWSTLKERHQKASAELLIKTPAVHLWVPRGIPSSSSQPSANNADFGSRNDVPITPVGDTD